MIIHSLLKDSNKLEKMLNKYKIKYKKVIEKDRTKLYQSYEFPNLPRYTYNEKWVNEHIRFDIKKKDWDDIDDEVKKLFGKPVNTYIYFKDYIKHKYEIKLPSNNKKIKYPIYVISYKRSHSLMTMGFLEQMKVNYYIVIKKCDKEDYVRELQNKDYKYYTLLIMSNKFFKEQTELGNGGGIPQRNYCWVHCRDKLKQKSHWILDDNINGFFYYNYDTKVKTNNKSFFSYMERFRNTIKDKVGIVSPNYTHHVCGYRKPFNVNNKNYSCLLINNHLLDKYNIKWEKRYNEDVRLTLTCFSNKIKTIEFNMFLIGKVSTGSVKGGNCEIYQYERKNYNKQSKDFYNNKEIFEKKILDKVKKYGYNIDYINGLYDFNEEYLYYRGFMMKFLEIYCDFPDDILLHYKHTDKRPHHLVNGDTYRKGKFSEITFKSP